MPHNAGRRNNLMRSGVVLELKRDSEPDDGDKQQSLHANNKGSGSAALLVLLLQTPFGENEKSAQWVHSQYALKNICDYYLCSLILTGST
ncbi:MAG: hypothetical protein LBT62_01850 [Deltaproteobacteria bacterium]|jgi:hypothetical protein|nr:hypothetical protein [Deltaproteobacteria bacterium]